METESFWKGLPSYPKVNKNNQNRYGYGCSYKRHRRYDRLTKRKTRRQIRRQGFDNTELWSLDISIMEFLSDRFGGFFRQCGNYDNWNCYDLEGNYTDFWENRDNEEYLHNSLEWSNKRYESYQRHLKDLLDNASQEDFRCIGEFCSPRLRKLAEITHGWPSGDDYPEFKDWVNDLNDMADRFDNGTYSDRFITYFWNLWD